MRVTVICSSRGRPEAAANLIKNLRATSNVECLFYLDEDDPSAYDVPSIRGPRVYNAAAFNFLAERVAPTSDYIVPVGDDAEFLTDGWDEILARNLSPDVAAMAGFARVENEDLKFINGAPRANHWCVTRAWYAAVRHLFRQGLVHYRIDTHICRMACDLKRFVWLPQIMVAHHRQDQGWDATSKDFMRFEASDKGIYKRLDWQAEMKTYADLFGTAKAP